MPRTVLVFLPNSKSPIAKMVIEDNDFVDVRLRNYILDYVARKLYGNTPRPYWRGRRAKKRFSEFKKLLSKQIRIVTIP